MPVISEIICSLLQIPLFNAVTSLGFLILFLVRIIIVGDSLGNLEKGILGCRLRKVQKSHLMDVSGCLKDDTEMMFLEL